MDNNTHESRRHILSLLVDNQPGVLSRVAGLFSGRGFNIDSLCVSETTDPLISRITLVAAGDMSIIEQIKKQLNKLVNVIKVLDFTDTDFVQRETTLVKVRAKPEYRAEILRMADIFHATVEDVGMEYGFPEASKAVRHQRDCQNRGSGPCPGKKIERSCYGKDRFWGCDGRSDHL